MCSVARARHSSCTKGRCLPASCWWMKSTACRRETQSAAGWSAWRERAGVTIDRTGFMRFPMHSRCSQPRNPDRLRRHLSVCRKHSLESLLDESFVLLPIRPLRKSAWCCSAIMPVSGRRVLESTFADTGGGGFCWPPRPSGSTRSTDRSQSL